MNHFKKRKDALMMDFERIRLGKGPSVSVSDSTGIGDGDGGLRFFDGPEHIRY